jgi:hypothetical protein
VRRVMEGPSNPRRCAMIEGSCRAMVQPELPISALFMIRANSIYSPELESAVNPTQLQICGSNCSNAERAIKRWRLGTTLKGRSKMNHALLAAGATIPAGTATLVAARGTTQGAIKLGETITPLFKPGVPNVQDTAPLVADVLFRPIRFRRSTRIRNRHSSMPTCNWCFPTRIELLRAMAAPIRGRRR